VLDASAGVEIALWTELGVRLSEHVADAEEIVVPDHFYVEVAAALRRMDLRGTLPEEESWGALQSLLSLDARRVDSAPLMADAWRLRRNVTIGDALYVVIAQRLDIALVTGDSRLAGAPGLGIEILGAA
jgi:predicted nucleic acid-binding protein